MNRSYVEEAQLVFFCNGIIMGKVYSPYVPSRGDLVMPMNIINSEGNPQAAELDYDCYKVVEKNWWFDEENNVIRVVLTVEGQYFPMSQVQ